MPFNIHNFGGVLFKIEFCFRKFQILPCMSCGVGHISIILLNKFMTGFIRFFFATVKEMYPFLHFFEKLRKIKGVTAFCFVFYIFIRQV